MMLPLWYTMLLNDAPSKANLRGCELVGIRNNPNSVSHFSFYCFNHCFSSTNIFKSLNVLETLAPKARVLSLV